VKELRISDSHLDQIEHLLAQSMNGIHLLFDNETIARVLKTPTDDKDLFNSGNLEKIQDLFSRFVEADSLDDKLSFLQSLDSVSYELLLRTYFHIVEHSLYASDTIRH
jgi:hypothetical protein